MITDKILRHQDLKREDRIMKAATAAVSFVKAGFLFDEDESMPELSEWIGFCEELNIEIKARSREACENHMRQAVFGELLANPEKAYSLLFENKQFQFFL